VFAGRASARERSRRGRRTALKRTAKPSGPGARGWRQVGGDGSNPTGSRSIANSPAMEARRIRLQGEPGISRQPTAQGTPECSDCTCMLVCVFFAHCLHTRPRVQQAPGVSCALLTWAKRIGTPRAKRAAGMRRCVHSSSSAKADDPVFQRRQRSNERPRRTGYPASAGYDRVGNGISGVASPRNDGSGRAKWPPVNPLLTIHRAKIAG
jgi:hypothetical protein